MSDKTVKKACYEAKFIPIEIEINVMLCLLDHDHLWFDAANWKGGSVQGTGSSSSNGNCAKNNDMDVSGAGAGGGGSQDDDPMAAMLENNAKNKNIFINR